MTRDQADLARHALGLPNRRGRTFRNYFVTGPGCSDFDRWLEMVDAGHATRRGPIDLFAGDSIFNLTREGALAALKPGEKLDPDDFPKFPKHPPTEEPDLDAHLDHSPAEQAGDR